MKGVKLMSRDKYDHYVNDEGIEIKASTSSSGKSKIDIYDSCPAENKDHGSIHINYDDNTGQGTITDTTKGDKETTDVSCYLTTACMKYMKECFDDNCKELTVLRWFRDHFVKEEDIKHYYQTAPMIIDSIEKCQNKDKIYHYIYNDIVLFCVGMIENGNYDKAYQRYKSGVSSFEETFLRPELQKRFVYALKYKIKTSK